ncbi:MAG: tetratricopeptide repeat protein [Oscillatoriales cyanobacterium]|nr:MAG: tetratricopeptide repeat protein [Oscillatoriales cyanobacterium]
MGQFKNAIASWDKAIELKPDDSETWYNRGLALVNLKRFKEAIVALKKIDRFTEAIASYDRIIAITPDDPNLYYQKACVYALEKAAGDRKNSPKAVATSIQKAIQNLSKAIELNPEKYRKLCQNDSKLRTIREEVRFLA